MPDHTKIRWTEASWNPVTGCSKVSPGCAHCYAETVTKRYAGRPGWPATFLPWTPENAAENVVMHPERLEWPLRWKEPRRVFVNSMSDLFHEQVPDEFIDRVFAVMALTPWHTYQILTKRPERMHDYMTSTDIGQWTGHATYEDQPWPAALWRIEAVHVENLKARFYPADVLNRASEVAEADDAYAGFIPHWPFANVWLGVSAENQHWADERIPVLLRTPAAVHFVSLEPLLGPVDLVDPCPIDDGKGPMGEWNYLGHPYTPMGKVYPPFNNQACGWRVRNIYGKTTRCGNFEGYPMHHGKRSYLNWVIVGGESGPGFRPMDLAWTRSLRDQCVDAGVAFFYKQQGGARTETGMELDGKRYEQFPAGGTLTGDTNGSVVESVS